MDMSIPAIRQSTASIAVHNPYSGNLVGSVIADDELSIVEVVENAKSAWREFRHSTPFERRSLLHALADQLAKQAEAFAKTISNEMGKTIREARNEVRRAQNTLRLSGDAITTLHGEIIPCAIVAGAPDKQAYVTHQSVGVVGAITPFNYPLNLLCHKLGPAIAAGNAVVAKPSPKAPLAAAMLAEAATRAGFPRNLFAIVHGGAQEALALARSPIDLLSFTGGPQAGLALKNNTGIIRCLMELGGNDPLIVMADADLEKAADTAVEHRFEIAGQSCAAVKKLYVQESVRSEMIGLLEHRIARMLTGDPADIETTMGPVIDAPAAQEVERRIQAAISDGATLIKGGNRTGTLVQPTLLDNVPAASELLASETFGPVLAIRSFQHPNDVIAELEDSSYGLQAGLFTNQHDTIQRFSSLLRVGGVMVNEGPDFRAENVPFGGLKSSGLGREGVHVTLREMSELKVVIV